MHFQDGFGAASPSRGRQEAVGIQGHARQSATAQIAAGGDGGDRPAASRAADGPAPHPQRPGPRKSGRPGRAPLERNGGQPSTVEQLCVSGRRLLSDRGHLSEPGARLPTLDCRPILDCY